MTINYMKKCYILPITKEMKMKILPFIINQFGTDF